MVLARRWRICGTTLIATCVDQNRFKNATVSYGSRNARCARFHVRVGAARSCAVKMRRCCCEFSSARGGLSAEGTTGARDRDANSEKLELSIRIDCYCPEPEFRSPFTPRHFAPPKFKCVAARRSNFQPHLPAWRRAQPSQAEPSDNATSVVQQTSVVQHTPRDARMLTRAATDKNYPSSSADECESRF